MTPGSARLSMHEKVRETPAYAIGGGAVLRVGLMAYIGAAILLGFAIRAAVHRHVVDLDEERKATMVSNLLVVLCSDHPTQPMVNAGSLYL